MRVLKFLIGRPEDWHLRRPSRPSLGPSPAWIGPLAIAASISAGWWAFTDVVGGPNTALGLWVGSASILLMAWSFVLAVRPTLLEPIFGGLDSMYRAHRWSGALAIGCMWLHTSIEPEPKVGVAGASESIAQTATDLAETGETMLYALVALSVIRLFPYRWWRLTHKLLGVPFALACWHFFTATKPYANGSAWGWWFGAWMVAGLASYVLRVVGIDMIGRGRRYTVVAAEHVGDTTRLELAPIARPLPRRAGQFAIVKLDVAGLREPHPFTISSSPDDPNLEFMIRHLGDWTSRLPQTDLVGSAVRVEGPFGRFTPVPGDDRSTLWVAGGVGATPFLAAVDGHPEPGRPVPTMLYATRTEEANPMLDRLRAAEVAGRLRLEVFTPTTGRMGPADLDRLFPDGLRGHHVAICGPAGLVTTMGNAARRRGATHVETEDFDFRQGFGPERSTELRRLTTPK